MSAFAVGPWVWLLSQGQLLTHCNFQNFSCRSVFSHFYLCSWDSDEGLCLKPLLHCNFSIFLKSSQITSFGLLPPMSVFGQSPLGGTCILPKQFPIPSSRISVKIITSQTGQCRLSFTINHFCRFLQAIMHTCSSSFPQNQLRLDLALFCCSSSLREVPCHVLKIKTFLSLQVHLRLSC